MKIIISILVFAMYSQQCTAWNDTGHKLTAIIAYYNMKQQTRDELLAVLERHPFFQRDFLNKMPNEVRNSTKHVRNSWLFAQAAIWPDMAKQFKIDEREQYSRNIWHYINFPLYANQSANKITGSTPANTALNPDDTQAQHYNVVQALTVAANQLARTKARQFPQSIWLCWYLHLVGDIHQPLHSVAFYTPHLFAQGDQGGGLLMVADTSLHSIWDQGAGNEWRHKRLVTLAKKRLAEFRNHHSLMFQPARWAYESVALARQSVYTPSIIDQIIRTEKNDAQHSRVAIELDKKYTNDMKTIATQRVVLAGLRLSETLEAIELHNRAQ